MSKCFHRFLNSLAVIAAMVGSSNVMASKLVAQERTLVIESSENYVIEPISAEQVSERIKKLAVTATAYQAACNAADEDFNGSPAAATRIALFKLKVLESAATAISTSAGAIENFRGTVLFDKSRIAADRVAVTTQARQLQSEIAACEKEVRLSGDQIQGEDADILLLAKKLERLEELREDTAAIDRSQAAIERTMGNLRTLDQAIITYSKLMEEETLRQANAISSNRIASQSVVLNQQAERLYSSVQILAPLVNSIKSTRLNRSVAPEIVSPELPSSIQPVVTPLVRRQVLDYLQSQESRGASSQAQPTNFRSKK